MLRNCNISKKLRSQEGASLPLALLLFLICAMAAAIVLAASTTAAGQATNMQESNQAYYSVASATNLLRDQLVKSDGEPHQVTVAVAKGPGNSYNAVISVDGSKVNNSSGVKSSLLVQMATLLLSGKEESTVAGAESQIISAAQNNWVNWAEQSVFKQGEIKYTLEASATGLDNASALTVDVKASLNSYGNLVFTISKKKGTGNNAQTLALFNLTCELDYEQETMEGTQSGQAVEIKYITLSWTPTTVAKAPVTP